MSAFSSSRAIIDLDAYAHNLGVARRFAPSGSALLAVVKADAYGHGILPIARAALNFGVDMLGVANVEEGLGLRKAGIEAPVLVMGQPVEAAVGPALEQNLRLMISDTYIADKISECARRFNKVARIHCKIDTGMGRQGFSLENAVSDMLYLTRVSNIDIEGVATHFPQADLAEDAHTQNQIKEFRGVLKSLEKRGIPYEMAHAANSAGIINYGAASAFDMVRPGLMTYGVWPTRDVPATPILKPVLRWETRVVLVKYVESGTGIGYGLTYTTTARTRIAMLPVGYADGYPHILGNRADVIIRGVRCPIRGSVSMDQIAVDVSNLPAVAVGDTATLLGADANETITADELATRAQTIPYEILTGIGARVAREYIGGE